MATQYIIDINHNDELPVVIRKCNENFRALLSQRLKQGQITNADVSAMISGVYEALTEEEAERVQADRLLQQLLNSNWFGNGDPTGSRDPSSAWVTEQNKLDHAGDLYWSTGTNGAVWYWDKTGSPAAWKWNLLNISGGSSESVILFDYDANTAKTIQLSDTAANYKMFQIIAKTNDDYRVSVDVYEPDGKSFSLTSGIAVEANDKIWFKTSSWTISGNTITYDQSGEHEDNDGRTNYGKDSTNQPLFLITQVIGYKEPNSIQLPGDTPTPTGDYNSLINKPTITEPNYIVTPPGYDPANSTTVTIQGDKSFDDLGMKHLSNVELQAIINSVA